MVGKIARDLAHGDLCRLIEREAVDARADGREIDRVTVIFARKAQAVAVAIGQQLRLAVQESPEFVDAWFELARLLDETELVMLLSGEESIREVIPFPMNKNAQDIMMGAPSEVTQKQLDELHIAVTAHEDE